MFSKCFDMFRSRSFKTSQWSTWWRNSILRDGVGMSSVAADL